MPKFDAVRFDELINSERSFAFYRLPSSKKVSFILHYANQPELFNEKIIQNRKGFVFMPFVSTAKCKPIFLSSQPYKSARKCNDARKRFAPVTGSKGAYESLVKDIKSGIKKGTFSKVVAARCLIRRKPDTFHPYHFFETLCNEYGHAFISLVYTPHTGLWIGASPELLLKHHAKRLVTYALAGSRSSAMMREWREKEHKEHGIVVDYIYETLTKIDYSTKRNFITESVNAANLNHLRTVMRFKAAENANWMKAAKMLHPTPAVAGMPRKSAIDFILKNEQSDRAYYSGYLGPVEGDKKAELFVNLRCMEVFVDKIVLYAGCGITDASSPGAEWKESQLKTETLLRLLKKQE